MPRFAGRDVGTGVNDPRVANARGKLCPSTITKDLPDLWSTKPCDHRRRVLDTAPSATTSLLPDRPHGPFRQFRHLMKLVMTHLPTKNSPAQDVTHPLRADPASLDHFRSTGELSRDSAPIPAMHDHHIPHSPERFLIAPSHSRTRRPLVGNIQYL